MAPRLCCGAMPLFIRKAKYATISMIKGVLIMEARAKSKNSSVRTSDNFLADVVRPRVRRVSYSDGFRFGIGLITAQLLVGIIVGGIAWALVVAFKLH